MNRIAHALHGLCLTARDFAWPPEPEPEPPAPRQSIVDIVYPQTDPATEATDATVTAWLDAAIAPVPADGCHHCDLPPGEHAGLRCAALIGPHPYTEPTTDQASARSKGRGYQNGMWKPC